MSLVQRDPHFQGDGSNDTTASFSSNAQQLPTNIVPPVGRSTLTLPAGASVTISATAPTTVTMHVEGSSGDASLVPQGLSFLLDSQPAPISPAHWPRLGLTPETTSNRKTMELWFHGNALERAGAGAVITIQPDDITWHVRHVLNGTRTCIDRRSMSLNQA
jgi:hypothetical protein